MTPASPAGVEGGWVPLGSTTTTSPTPPEGPWNETTPPGALANGSGPGQVCVALGYAGWEAGQLEAEMLQNAWLTVPFSERIVFDLPFEDRWQAAVQLLGIDASRLSHIAGRA